MPESICVSTCVRLLLSAALLAAPALAQGRLTIRGEVQTNTPLNLIGPDCYVELSPIGDHFVKDRALVNRDGSFVFRDLQTGTYQLRVVNLHGDSLHEETLLLHDGIDIRVRVDNTAKGSAPPTGKVSVQALKHPIPSRAIKEYLKGKQSAASGNLEQAIVHFHKAVETHPTFFEAWNDLGVVYVHQHRLSEAEQAFEKAAAAEPNSEIVRKNLAITRAWRPTLP